MVIASNEMEEHVGSLQIMIKIVTNLDFDTTSNTRRHLKIVIENRNWNFVDFSTTFFLTQTQQKYIILLSNNLSTTRIFRPSFDCRKS